MSTKEANGNKLNELKERIYSIIESSKNAISEEELSIRMSNVDKSQRVKALNLLLNESKIKVVMNKNKISYELVVVEKSLEDIVLDLVKESDRNGIWVRDIRTKTHQSQVVVNKAVKSLENKKKIRAIKSISNRKFYVLYDLEPDESVTGGACYESGFIREDVVKNLKSACFQFLYDRYKECYDKAMIKLHSADDSEPLSINSIDSLYASALDVFNKFKETKIFQEIKQADIEHILNILFYECKLMKLKVTNKILYRYNPYNRDKTDMFYAPCMVCHLYQDCKPGSSNIAPETCQYQKPDTF